MVFRQPIQKLEQRAPYTSVLHDDPNECSQCSISTAGSKVRALFVLSRTRAKLAWLKSCLNWRLCTNFSFLCCIYQYHTQTFTFKKLVVGVWFVNRDLKQLGRENVDEEGCWNFNFPFSCLHNSCDSLLFCLKACEYEKLEALFLKLHEDWNDSYSNVQVLYKTPELRFSRSVSKGGGKVARWLHSHVKWLYLVIKSTVLWRSRWFFPSSFLKLSNSLSRYPDISLY